MTTSSSTDIRKVSFKASIIFPILLIVFIGLLTTSLTLGTKSGELDKTIIKPLKQFSTNMQSAVQQAFKETPTEPAGDNLYLNTNTTVATSDSTINIRINNTAKKYPTLAPYTPPTFVYPTVRPGDPGSREWEDKFQRDWDTMQKEIDEAKKQQCQRSPQLCR